MILFSRYEYNPQKDLIGKGGFSRVYKAFDKKLNRWLALKIYRITELDERYSAVAEIQRVIHLDHPNICRYMDIEEIEKEDSFGEKEMIQVCVMELMDAGDMGSYYRSKGNDNELFKKMLKDVLRGLSYLHKNGVIHRDIKPANILIKETVEGPVAKITDFGISKNSNSTDNSSSSALIVSIPYMAPEQLNAKKYGIDEKISFNIDFWSLGVAVYETITGDVLFKITSADSREQVMNNIMQPELPEKISSLPQPFMDFVARCLVKDAKARVQQADELLAILDRETLEVEKKEKPADAAPLIENAPQALTKEPAVEDAILENPVLPETDTEELLVKKNEELSFTSTLILQQPESEEDTQMLSKPALDETTRLEKPTSSNKEPVVQTQQLSTANLDETISLFHRYDYNPGSGLIGKGGFSRVYKAYDNRLSRWVALKIYKPGDFSEHYSPIAEIRRVINLDHSNICRYLDMEEVEKENSFGEKEKTQICVMELLDSGNFAQYYKLHPQIEVLKKLLNDVLNGISYLHKNGIIHRDIKPANILIKETIDGPVAKITDFGISKKSDSSVVNTSSALIVSIPYMAPEQLNPAKYGINEKVSFNLDLWSLGVTVYEVVTGKVLFKNTESDTPEQIMANIMQPDLPEKINELPQPFRNIVSHCVVKDARERAQKAEELIVLLHGNFEEQPVHPIADLTEPLPAPERTFKKNTIEESERPAKPSFFVEKANEDQPSPAIIPFFKPKTKKAERILYYGIASVAAVLLFFTLYNVFSHKVPAAGGTALSAPAMKKDSASVASHNAVPLPATDSSNEEKDIPEKTMSATSVEKEPAKESMPKVSKRSAEKSKDIREGNKSAGTQGNKKYILELSTNETCSIKIDNIDYGTLEQGKGMKVYLLPGKYTLQASGNNKSFTGILDVKQEFVNEVGQYKIILK